MRIFRIVATPILLLALLAFLVWGAWWGWRNLTAPIPEPEPTACVSMATETITAADVAVRIYNGGFTSGLAYRVSQALTEAGMNIMHTGNTEERIKATVVRGAQSDQAAVELVASYFKDATVEYDDRVTGVIDIFVGSEYGGFADEPLGSTTPDSGTKCLPPELAKEILARQSPTPSPSPTSGG
ncbi:MAG: LytR C-terminal domain-containing protein [Arachnia sp.]